MKKKNIKIKLLILFSLLFVVLSSCSSSPYSYQYPKEYSAEYCFGQYEFFDPNITYTACYEFVSKDGYGYLPSTTNFSGIKNCEDLSFMVCFNWWKWMGSSIDVDVVRKKDSSVNPITDCTPSRIELIWYPNPWIHPDLWRKGDAEEKEEYYNKDAKSLSNTVRSIDSKEAIDEILNIATKDVIFEGETFRQELEEHDTINRRSINSEEGSLYVKIYFEDCEGLVFLGEIMLDAQGYSYMTHKVYTYDASRGIEDATSLEIGMGNGDDRILCYRLGENMDAIIQEVLNSME